MGNRRMVRLLPLLLLLSACGYQSDVTRLPPADAGGATAEQKTLRDDERRMVRQGLRLSAESQPRRVDDLTVSLKERSADPFALPPSGTDEIGDVPFPGDEPVSLRNRD